MTRYIPPDAAAFLYDMRQFLGEERYLRVMAEVQDEDHAGRTKARKNFRPFVRVEHPEPASNVAPIRSKKEAAR